MQAASPHAQDEAGLLQDLLSPDKLQQHGVVRGVQDAPLQRASSSCYFGYELSFPSNCVMDGSKVPLNF